jgi:hypothetical protein
MSCVRSTTVCISSLDTLAKIVVKSTGQVGYFVKESRAGELLIRVPRTDGWPFPDYITVKRKDVKAYRKDKSKNLEDIPLAPF